jgi:hypothetical protein
MMGMFVRRCNIFKRLLLRILSIPITIDNIRLKRQDRKHKLKYSDIVGIEYHSLLLPDCIEEDMNITEKIGKKEYKEIIKIFEKNKVLKWKHHYFTTISYCDGGSWDMVIRFKDGYTYVIDGDITLPKNFHEVFINLEKYIKTKY